MYAEALTFLACPRCRAKLVSHVGETSATGEILTATIACSECERTFAVREGIADFLGAPHPATPAQVVNEWKLTAWAYERLWRPFALTLLSQSAFPYRRELPLIARLVQPQRGGLYLDVACSNGLYARALARVMGAQTGHVIGIDHAWPMLVDARRRAIHAGLRISYIRAEAQTLPVQHASAAGVVIGGSLNEIGDLDTCLDEVRRVLHEDGRFVAMTLTQARTAGGKALQRAMASGGIQFWSVRELLKRFADHHLAVSEHEAYGIVLFTSHGSAKMEDRQR